MTEIRPYTRLDLKVLEHDFPLLWGWVLEFLTGVTFKVISLEVHTPIPAVLQLLKAPHKALYWDGKKVLALHLFG